MVVLLNYTMEMEEKLSCSVSVHEEKMDGERFFVAECNELGVSDFGRTINEALSNLKKGINLLLEESPEKRYLLKEDESTLVTRIFL